MPGVVFLITIPTANYEKELLNGNNYGNNELPPPSATPHGNNLNINLPETNNAILRLEVELRDKNSRPQRFHQKVPLNVATKVDFNNYVPMERILEELLKKLEIDHVTWSIDKKVHFHQIIFPIQSGDPCETTLHCLTELGIGSKLKSTISVLPCSVSYDAVKDNLNEEFFSDDDSEEYSKWNNFVESIKSKLTVKQVVDGVRAGGQLSFDYLLLIVTADSLAALGLVENNAPNIVAAMLVSPLMGPVMSITFGAIISDRELMKVGLISLALGMFISLCFGFIFGLILGTTSQPWGYGDWPTEEMKGRGNARSLWMGVLWALTSGTGVAVALLQGSTGPLIGVAISASLLPPVVNCGLYWALACIWLIYDGVKIPHIKGEGYTGNSTYVPIYTNYIPTEFLINGIVSALLTVVNVMCIFITAIIVLKIKEVAAPYTSSPDLRRFWETDIRAVRKTNRSTIRRGGKMTSYSNFVEPKNQKNLESALERAIQEVTDDTTFRKVKRMSYSGNAADELSHRFPTSISNSPTNSRNPMSLKRNAKLTTDLEQLDKLVTSLLDHQTYNQDKNGSRLRRGSHSLRLGGSSSYNLTNSGCDGGESGAMPTILETNNIGNRTTSWSDRPINLPGVRRVLNSIANAPHRFSQISGNQNEENTSLTQNNLG